jgi:hypothetical protein
MTSFPSCDPCCSCCRWRWLPGGVLAPPSASVWRRTTTWPYFYHSLGLGTGVLPGYYSRP